MVLRKVAQSLGMLGVPGLLAGCAASTILDIAPAFAPGEPPPIGQVLSQLDGYEVGILLAVARQLSSSGVPTARWHGAATEPLATFLILSAVRATAQQ